MHIEIVAEAPSDTARHTAGKYGPFIDSLGAQKAGWLRIAFTELPGLANGESIRAALRQVATRHGIKVDTCIDAKYVYIRRVAIRPSQQKDTHVFLCPTVDTDREAT